MDFEITGILLAGGHFRRMATNKAFIRLNEKFLIDHALDILMEVSPHIILSVGSEPFCFKNLPPVSDVFKQTKKQWL